MFLERATSEDAALADLDSVDVILVPSRYMCMSRVVYFRTLVFSVLDRCLREAIVFFCALLPCWANSFVASDAGDIASSLQNKF